MTESELLAMMDDLDMTCDDLRLDATRRAVLSAMPDGDEADGDEARAILDALDVYEGEPDGAGA